MNKEVKEIIDRLKDNANSDGVDEKGYFFELYISEKDLLLDYIKQLESTLNEVREWKDKNGNRYIYQDGLGEDWYFEDLDVFNELGEILERGNKQC